MKLSDQAAACLSNRAFVAGFLVALAITALIYAFPGWADRYPLAAMLLPGLWPTGILMGLIGIVFFGIEADAGWRTLPLFIGFALLNGATYRFIFRRLYENQRIEEGRRSAAHR